MALRYTRVLFKNKEYNYGTSLSKDISNKDIETYFVNTSFNLGAFPVEDLQVCIGVIPNPTDEELNEHLQINASSEDYSYYREALVDLYPKVVMDVTELHPASKERLEKLYMKNKEIQFYRQFNSLAITTPKVGDFVQKGDSIKRIAHLYDDGFQLAYGGSYYIGKTGNCVYSGGFDPFIEGQLKPTTEHKPGFYWFFSQDCVGGNRGYYCYLQTKVWTY